MFTVIPKVGQPAKVTFPAALAILTPEMPKALAIQKLRNLEVLPFAVLITADKTEVFYDDANSGPIDTGQG